MNKDEALKLALEALENSDKLINGTGNHFGLEGAMDGYYSGCFDVKGNNKLLNKAITAIKEAMAQPEQEPDVVTILPDGSAFGVMSFPLPDDHWIYAPNEYRNGEYKPIDLPKPILTHAMRGSVVAAVRYAVRGATMQGKETDFDPDAIVQNAVYALCGPYTTL